MTPRVAPRASASGTDPSSNDAGRDAAGDGAGDAAPRALVPEAYERLRRLIVSGQLAPGMRLVEVELAERLGMSRTPVRTALFLLHQQGYV
jgi:DNA-binding GntR family transcriptional regulator